MNKSEKKRLKFSLILPIFFVFVMWVVKLYEYYLNLHFYEYGIYPQRFENLSGIFLGPFIHGDFKHLISNTFPFLILGTGLFYFYRKYAYKVFWLIFIFSGFWVWLAARPSYHIGASGVIYGLASFLIFSGLIHKNKALTAVSLITVFLYGSMVWGVLPIKPGVSWEGHLFGAITGLIISIAFANKKPLQEISEKKEQKEEISEFSEPTVSNDTYNKVEYFYEEDKNV